MELNYKSSLGRYRRYLQVVQQQPLWQASIYVILSLVLIIVLIFSALRPTLVTIAGLLGQIRQERDVEKKMDEKIAVIQKAQQVYQQEKQRLGVLDEAVPSGPVWAKFAKGVEKIATESGVVLETMSITGLEGGNETPDLGSLVKMNFTLSVTGEYPQLRNFADMLEDLRRIADISNLTITKSQDSRVMSVSGIVGFIEEFGGE